MLFLDIYVDGVLNNNALHSGNGWCGEKEGHLYFGQDQDGLNSKLDNGQAPPVSFDYIYMANGIFQCLFFVLYCIQYIFKVSMILVIVFTIICILQNMTLMIKQVWIA